MVRLLAVAFATVAATAAGDPPADTITVPRESAERIVKDNLRLQGEVESLVDENNKLRQHRNKLQSATNCS
jgi:hypothetical protein